MNTWQEPKPNWSLSQLLESKGTFFNFKVVLFPKLISSSFLGNSQSYYKTLRKESMTIKSVKYIAKNTKTHLTKNSQIVNSKETNQKFKNWFERFILIKMVLQLKFNLTTKQMMKKGKVKTKSEKSWSGSNSFPIICNFGHFLCELNGIFFCI